MQSVHLCMFLVCLCSQVYYVTSIYWQVPLNNSVCKLNTINQEYSLVFLFDFANFSIVQSSSQLRSRTCVVLDTQNGLCLCPLSNYTSLNVCFSASEECALYNAFQQTVTEAVYLFRATVFDQTNNCNISFFGHIQIQPTINYHRRMGYCTPTTTTTNQSSTSGSSSSSVSNHGIPASVWVVLSLCFSLALLCLLQCCVRMIKHLLLLFKQQKKKKSLKLNTKNKIEDM